MRFDDLLAATKLESFLFIVFSRIVFLSKRENSSRSEPSFGYDSLEEDLPDVDRMLRQLLNPETATISEPFFDAFSPVSQSIQTQQELLVEFHPDKNSSSHAKEVFQPLGCAFLDVLQLLPFSN